MKRHWDEQGLAEHWSLTHDEFVLARNRTDRSRLGFAVLLKFFQVEGRFPSDRREEPGLAPEYLAKQIEVSTEAFSEYEVTGRSCERDRAQIRAPPDQAAVSLGLYRPVDSEVRPWMLSQVTLLEDRYAAYEHASFNVVHSGSHGFFGRPLGSR
jgi:hypothetical protein